MYIRQKWLEFSEEPIYQVQCEYDYLNSQGSTDLQSKLLSQKLTKAHGNCFHAYSTSQQKGPKKCDLDRLKNISTFSRSHQGCWGIFGCF